jgi:CoA:oxalate CoA-transferase
LPEAARDFRKPSTQGREMKALEGIRVIELCHAYNGPFCCMLLADQGAEVLKIEPPEGDQCRDFIPFHAQGGESAFYTYLNRNKKGGTLNLKHPKALELFYGLVKTADVVVENYRSGVAKKLKVDYETLRRVNPGIIYAASSGFGQYGPLAHRPCYDMVAQAMGGMISLTGYPDAPPVKCGPSVADNVTGTFLCVGVLTALLHREKTGTGQMVDVSMVDTIFSLLENAIPLYTANGVIAERKGNIDPTIAPFDVFEASDGYVAMGVGTDRLFRSMCEAMDMPRLAEDPRYADNGLRVDNYLPDLRDAINSWTKTRTKAELERIFEKAGVPCGPVLNIKEAIEHPHILAREMMVHIEHPSAGDCHVQGVPIKLSATPGSVDTPAPLLGQHTGEIFGLSAEQVARLKEEGVF